MLVITRGYMFTKHPSTLGTRCWSLRCSSYSVCWPRARHSCRPRTSLRWRSRWWDDFISGPGGPPMGGCPGSSYSTIDLLLYYFSSSSCYILYISYIILLYYDIIRLIWIIFFAFLLLLRHHLGFLTNQLHQTLVIRSVMNKRLRHRWHSA